MSRREMLKLGVKALAFACIGVPAIPASRHTVSEHFSLKSPRYIGPFNASAGPAIRTRIKPIMSRECFCRGTIVGIA